MHISKTYTALCFPTDLLILHPSYRPSLSMILMFAEYYHTFLQQQII